MQWPNKMVNALYCPVSLTYVVGRNHTFRGCAPKYTNNSRHLAQKYAWIFVCGHYLFREAYSFPRAKLEENCELGGTDNVQGQISEHIFTPNGGHCLYYPSNLFHNLRSFENWGIFSDIPQFQLGNIQSHDAFRPIAHE